LTFDDGPKKGTTDIILEALEKYDAHATFFVLGNMAEKNPQLLREMAEYGHDIGSHTWNHRLMTKLSEEEMIKQINQTKLLINEITGKEPTLFRPPYGAYDQRVMNHLGNTEVILWDIDPEDWKYQNKDYIVQAVMNRAGDGKIVLMHDIYQTSAEAAVEIMEQLTAQDYKIVSVSELLEIKKQREQVS
ncbi:MAG: polysaccharide deacetylase family protein, partial [Lysinibacillus sp.]